MSSHTLNVALSPDQERFIQDRISAGRFITPEQMIAEGLRLLEEKELLRQQAMDDLRREIQLGTDEADRGELVDGSEVFARIRQLSAERRASTR